MELTSDNKSDKHLDSSLCMDIQNHRRVAIFLTQAAKLHLEAAKQRLEENPEQIAEHIQKAKDLLLRTCAMQQSARLHVEAAKQRLNGISLVSENETVQNLLRQVTEIKLETEIHQESVIKPKSA